MVRKTSAFIALSAIITAGYLAALDLLDKLSPGFQSIGSIILLIVFFWLFFDGILKIIYRFSGVERQSKKPKTNIESPRLTHQQAAAVNRYWIIWLATSMLVSASYILIFARGNWKTAALWGSAIVAVLFLAYLNTRQRIMGHSKKDLFR